MWYIIISRLNVFLPQGLYTHIIKGSVLLIEKNVIYELWNHNSAIALLGIVSGRVWFDVEVRYR
jgi:hypothetical protein